MLDEILSLLRLSSLSKALAAFLVLALLGTVPAWGQQNGEITGTVTDAGTGNPVPGVNVHVVGTTQGASTDAENTYTITGIEPGTYDVQASFVGYGDELEEGVEVAAGETTTVDFAMQQGALGLDEVVVVGYGQQQRRNLTDAVSSVSTSEIEELPVASIEHSLQGRVAGVQVQQGGGDLQGDFKVRIRGVSSLGNTEPLYVVDGVPLYSGSLATLSRSSIQSMEVLKGASATAIYGARAANGVVLITTKAGQVGDTEVTGRPSEAADGVGPYYLFQKGTLPAERLVRRLLLRRPAPRGRDGNLHRANRDRRSR